MKWSEELQQRLEQHRKPKRYACGMCPSCYQREACPGGSDGRACSNYLPPEPTKREMADIYRKALADREKPCDTSTQVHRIGRVNGLRDALVRFYGFTLEEVKRIEGSDDRHHSGTAL